MKIVRWLSATAGTAIIAATFALPAGVAYAAGPGNGNTTGVGNVSAGSGNTVNAPVSAPVDLCSISVGLLGFANSGCQGGASSTVTTDPGGSGSGNGNVTGVGNGSLLSGNTVNAPVSAPVSICGVSAAGGGYANSHCAGGAHSTTTIGSGAGGSGGGNGNVEGVGNLSLGSGNTVNAPISAPISVCGISLALLGFSNAECVGGATTDATVLPGGSSGNTTGVGNVSALSGNTINAPVSLPVSVCSVSLGVLGFANSSCQGVAAVNPPPACHGGNCSPPPACHGGNCSPPPACTGSACTPPHHTTPPGRTPPGVTPPGITPPGTTTVTSATMPGGSSLPTTGADLLALAGGAVALTGAGAGAIVLSRRRRGGTAA
jgi:hypothetical protein